MPNYSDDIINIAQNILHCDPSLVVVCFFCDLPFKKREGGINMYCECCIQHYPNENPFVKLLFYLFKFI